MLLGLLLSLACNKDPDLNYGDDSTVEGPDSGELLDQDGDGYTADEDCDDFDSNRAPGLDEECDGVDNDCDEEIDEGAGSDWYTDADGDGFGDENAEVELACSEPAGSADNNGDCNDDDSAVNPNQFEVCDGIDNDCDGEADGESALDAETWYRDADYDGYGDPDETTLSCEEPTGYTDNDDDCDDSTSTSRPGADEQCDGEDNDCDGEIDEGEGAGDTYYADTDSDGYGDPDDTVEACSAPTGYVESDDDCDDDDADIHPGATETCDGVDEDCDGDIDDGATGSATWYPDADSDGYGDADGSTLTQCEQPSGYVSDDTDCDDTDGDVNPGADEECDDSTDTTTACEQPSGYVSDDTDCDDTTADVSPEADEECDSIDNDCDGDIDEDDAVDGTTWYADDDGDSYGDPYNTTTACSVPSGYTSDSSDCDDTDSGINTAATEACDGFDNNCDGDIDEGFSATPMTWYADDDGDGFGDPDDSMTDCSTSAPSGYADDDTDCDDSDSSVNPGADEYCDSIDNDCDDETDEDDAVDASTFYADSDSDGYGDSDSTTAACSAPTGYVSDDTDCDDDDDSANPGATEYCDDTDNDCDGDTDEDDAADATDWFPDSDSDGYGDETASATAACDAPSGYVSDDTDCDDSAADVNPGEDEYCDTTDHDCDGDTEDGAVDAISYYTDGDGDGYGDESTSTDSCSAVSGLTATGGDCDDSDSSVSPAATEYCDSIDNDCDDETDEDDAADASTYYADTDGDGDGDSSSTTTACSVPSGYSSTDTDCDDTDSATYDGASETCHDGTVNDCSGTEAAALASCIISSEESGDYSGYVYGSTGGDELATAIGVVPDYNGDGNYDFVFGAPYAQDGASDQGLVFIVYGPLSADIASDDTDVQIKGEGTNDEFGLAVAVVDLDNDGTEDLVVGSPDVTPAGAIYILSGPVTSDHQVSNAERIGGSTNGDCGTTIAGAGDVDGDGLDDLLVGCPRYSYKKGRVHLALGPVTITKLTNSHASWDGGTNDDDVGAAVAPVGDTNGDGYDDIGFGAPGYSSEAGLALVVLGPVSGGGSGLALSAADATISGSSAAACGSSVGYVGDIDGDGYDDVFSGCSVADRLDIYYGPVTGTLGPASANHQLSSSSGGQGFGDNASMVGDVNADGVDDFAVGAPLADTAAGAVYLFWGPLSGGSPTADASITGESLSAFGSGIWGGEDFDSDGYSDLLVSAPTGSYPSYSNAGYAFLIPGADY